jgi:DNA transposition AAA+ family ATPase
MSDESYRKELAFTSTKPYRLFSEFSDACTTYRYIGVCQGVAGAGKTRSALEYARWKLVKPLLPQQLFTLAGKSHSDGNFPHRPFASLVSPTFREILPCHTVYYTAPVSATASRIEREVTALCAALSYLVEAAEEALRGKDDFLMAYRLPERTKLLIVDEANRLTKMAAMEQLRDLYDRGNFGLILMGMPGLEKSLARYPQLYSRIGFVHQFHVLSDEEMRWLLEQHLDDLGMPMRADDFTDQEAVSAVIRITSGNFRILHRLLTQIERILKVNETKLVTKEVVEAARQNLVLGEDE